MRSVSIIVIVLAFVAALALLWALGPGAVWVLEDVDQVTTLQDKDRVAALAAIRGNVLAVATGLAALLAVFYTARNADTARRTLQLGERGHDTDRFSKAVEQLGSAHAPVRLGGIYALEQLAQSNPALRQMVMDIVCAYLRMPYTPPREDKSQEKTGTVQRILRTAIAGRAFSQASRGQKEEREVRLAAQRILTEHLRWRKPRRWQKAAAVNPLFWEDIDLDLSGATLLNLNLNQCRIKHAYFGGAVFVDGPWFGEAIFDGRAWFAGATFTGRAAAVASFARATFKGDGVFQGSTFGNLAQFRGATFASGAWFATATFNNADFTGVTFKDTAEFGGTAFTGDARFNKANFVGDARFSYIEAEEVDFSEARAARPNGNHAWPPGWHLETTLKGAELRRGERPLSMGTKNLNRRSGDGSPAGNDPDLGESAAQIRFRTNS